jgi:lysophospholipase L1-like esterase
MSVGDAMNHRRSLRFLKLRTALRCSAVFAAWVGMACAEHEGKLQILLLGDSTTQGSVPRQVRPQGPHLEDVIRILLAAEEDLPPCQVINLGVGGEFIRRLLDSGRYDRDLAKRPGVDFVFIRYGWCDVAYRENFDVNFPKDYGELIGRLRKDHPAATPIVMSFIPVEGHADRINHINSLAAQVAKAEGVPFFDFSPRYIEEQKRQGPKMLVYRRLPLATIPEKYHALVKPFVSGNPPEVIVMDNELDALLRDVPGWLGELHPNLAGYNIIADETAKFLAKMIRTRRPAK